MKHIFIDLEFCSCFKMSSPLMCETIQVGAVILDENNKLIAEYGRLVCPDFAQSIPSKEREITGITWDMVKDEACFYDVISDFVNWCNLENEEYLIYSWSDNDALQLLRESQVKGYPLKELGLFDHWVDLQRCFMTALNLRNQKSLEHALELIQIEFAGDAHKADVDAYNTARLFKFMCKYESISLKIELLKNIRKNLFNIPIARRGRNNPRYKNKPNIGNTTRSYENGKRMKPKKRNKRKWQDN